jgi:phthalate 4,5-cis-dihydrodiol dehydrogenase
MTTSSSEPIMRVGIAGLGAGGANAMSEVPGLIAHPTVRLTAAADPRPAAREQFAREVGGETFASIEDLCASPTVDAVYILTPSRMHADHAIIAAERGKQIILDKPMALTLADCDRVIDAVERHGVRCLLAHSQSMDIGILKMAEIARSGALGRLLMVHTSFFSDWLYRPRSREELDPANGDNLVLRQGPVQVDIARLIGGGLVQTVRASATAVDPARPIEGSYAAFLGFEDRAAAILEYSAYAHFDSSELTGGFGLGGRPRAAADSLSSRNQISSFARPEEDWEHKDRTRYGGGRARGAGRAPERHQFFGFTLMSCEHGDVRQTPRGLHVYGDRDQHEIALPIQHYPKTELDVMYRAWSRDEPLAFSDAHWGRATLEVCLGILASSREARELTMSRQTSVNAENLRPFAAVPA